MPNNRNRNRNRNRNKRNKQQTKETTTDEKQLEQAEKATTTSSPSSSSSTAATAATTLKAADNHHNDNNANSGNISNGSSAASDSITVADGSPAVVDGDNNNINNNAAPVNQPADQSADLAKDQPVIQPKIAKFDQLIEETKATTVDQAKEQAEDRCEDQSTICQEDQLQQPEDQLIEQANKVTKTSAVHTEDQLGDRLEDQLELQAKQPAVQELSADQVTETYADHTKDQLQEHCEDQLEQPENLHIEQVKAQQTDQVKVTPGDQNKNQFIDPLEDQLQQQPKQPVVHLVPIVVEKEEQPEHHTLQHSEDQLEKQPTVHIVPVSIEKQESWVESAERQLIEQSANYAADQCNFTAEDQSEDQPRVHIVPVFVQKNDRSEDQSADRLKDQPKPAVHLIPVKLDTEEICLKQTEQQSSSTMGAKNSKQQQLKTELPQQQQQLETELPQQQQKVTNSSQQAKVIVHRIVRDSSEETDVQQQQQLVAPQQSLVRQQPPLQRSTKVIIHQIRVETDEEERARKGKPTIEEISSTTATTTTATETSTATQGTLSPPPRYLVESPSPKNVSSVVQFGKFARDVQIQELEMNSDCSSGEFNSYGMQSPVVCEVDSETEATTPVAVKAFSPDLPSSSRAEQQEQLRQKRAQKRNALETHFLPQLLSPRYLDSILEENSEAAAGSDPAQSRNSNNNDSSKTRPTVPQMATESFPRSQLDFSRRHKRREEPVALMLETKLLEQPSDLESCTRLQSTLSPQSEDAELVYLSSSASSSVSDLMELELEQAAALAERALIDLDTDASKLINRPDDELSSITTTEPVSSSNETETEGECEVETEVDTETEATQPSSRESTPVNAQPTNEENSPNSSLSSLLSAATPTPAETQTEAAAAAAAAATAAAPPTRAFKENERAASLDEVPLSLVNEFGPNKLANSRTAAPSLSVTREEFVRSMEKVRELIEMTRREENAIDNGNSNGNGNVNVNVNGYENLSRLNSSPSPPPVPPPPSSLHYPTPNQISNTDQLPVLTPLLLKRQESNDSHCSDSTQHSQCTAINLASPPPTNQPPTPPIRQQPPIPTPTTTQLQLSAISKLSGATDAESIKKLRLLCTETLASMPYGEQMLEELATVAQNISEQQQQPQQQQSHDSNMPYPLPQLPHISDLQLSLGAVKDESWLGLPTKADPKLLVCLSPAQRALVEQQQQQLPAAPDQLLDAHEKFVQRRGYHELSAEQVRAMDSEQLKLEQEQILKTAAKMRELRKSLTPTSPTPTAAAQQPQQQQLLPPPVPVKSAETAAKAKSQADDARERSYQKVITSTATSSVENKPTAAADAPQQSLPHSFEQRTSQQQQHSSYMASSNTQTNSKFPASMESELARMFPSIAQQGDIFDEQRKRFSNIEQSGQQKPEQSKRYSNIETSTFESKKRTENGQVVYDYSNSSREQQQQGEKPKFPLVLHDEVDCAAVPPPVPPPPAATNIMSAAKLNGKANTFIDDAQQQQQQQQRQQRQQQQQENSNSNNSAEQNNSTKVNNVGGTYEEFRQRAKAAIAAIGQPNSNISQPLDNEKLFKDFDALSQQLNAELQTSRDQREQRDKSASLYDLSRLSSSSSNQQQLQQLKQQRHAHMQELEREIERSSKSRQERLSSVPRTTEIPIELSADYAARSRRAESLCNLNEPMRPHSSAEHYRAPVDDWSRYANDLGYSENIARPFAREVEICYQRQGQKQPHGIRAPRLSVSTNDLSSSSYDSYNAYGGARRHAPMLQQAPQQQRPHFASCYSMIERNPNPTYISTTSRRGVSPAPAATQLNTQPPAYDRQQRRASLPRELHEQQLKYILSKEEELKLEFERLQQERRRLMDEMQRAPTVLQAPPPRRESYRPAPKLPTLSEDEVFRQQMAEEWMNKVAEREERRQHKIIKISKIEDEQQHATEEQTNISDEFLNRVKERRHKLSMPADSDWESGAESQPVQLKNAGSESDVEAPPMRVLEGQAEANLRELPRHLREFAKFSTCEQLEGGQGQVERHEEQERSEMATDNSLSSASKKSTIVKTYKVSRLPPSVQDDNNANTDNNNSNIDNKCNNNNNNKNNSNTTTTTSSTTSCHTIKHESNSNTSSNLAPNPNPTTPASPSPSSSPFLGNLHRNFDELFAHSPFRSKIIEEFDKYWRNFEHTTSDTF